MKNKLFYVFKEKIKLKYILFNYIYNWSGTKKKKKFLIPSYYGKIGHVSRKTDPITHTT